jgi:hypothetical protein
LIFVDEENYEYRIGICRACPELKQPLKMDVCGKCGCFMVVKARLKNSECPIGKWGKYLDEEKNSNSDRRT